MFFAKKITELYKKNLLVRYDDTGTVHYFTAADFDGLCAEPFSFVGDKGQDLRGNIYYYGQKSSERLVVLITVWGQVMLPT